jgi:predicted acylesterase/phospholipase RssA
LANINLPPIRRPCFLGKDGPENGPYFAAVSRTARKIFRQNGTDIAGMYVISGSTPSGILSASYEEDRVCDIWLNLKPEDIVGNASAWKSWTQTLWGLFVGRESILSGNELRALLEKNINLDNLFSDYATKIVVVATDYATSKPIFATNKIPEHRSCIIDVALGSMALVPWFPAVKVEKPADLKLTDANHTDDLYLIDGAYSNSFPLQEIINDETNFDSIFIVDINGLKHFPADVNDKNFLSLINKFRKSSRIALQRRDEETLNFAHKVNEHIRIKQKLREVEDCLPPVYADKIASIIRQMENGVLKLSRKKAIPIYIISNRKHAKPFNFASFKPEDVKTFMKAGHNAALTTMRKLGLNTKGFRLNQFPK